MNYNKIIEEYLWLNRNKMNRLVEDYMENKECLCGGKCKIKNKEFVQSVTTPYAQINKDFLYFNPLAEQKFKDERFFKPKAQEEILEILKKASKNNEVGAYKETEGKLFYELDWSFVTEMAQRMASNKKNNKYSLFNWKIPMTPKGIEDLKQATMRHLLEVMQGRYEDDTELGHIIAIANNAMILNYQLKNLQDKK